MIFCEAEDSGPVCGSSVGSHVCSGHYVPGKSLSVWLTPTRLVCKHYENLFVHKKEELAIKQAMLKYTNGSFLMGQITWALTKNAKISKDAVAS